MTDEPEELELIRDDADIDHDAEVDQDAVTSYAELDGTLVVRTYSDGAVQRIVFESEELAEDYINSLVDQEG